MSRPRKNFFIRFDEIHEAYSNPDFRTTIGATITAAGREGNYTILKIHPRKGGVTARKTTQSTKGEKQ